MSRTAIDTAFSIIVYPLGSFIASWLVATGSPDDAAGVALVCGVLLVAMGAGAACRLAARAMETRKRLRFTTSIRSTYAD